MKKKLSQLVFDIEWVLNAMSSITEIFGDVFDGASLIFRNLTIDECDRPMLFFPYITQNNEIIIHIPYMLQEAVPIFMLMMRGLGYSCKVITTGGKTKLRKLYYVSNYNIFVDDSFYRS